MAHPGSSAVLLGLAAAAAFISIATTRADVDLWGHVLFGAEILRGGLRSVDPYSFTSDRPWLNHEWLSELAFALAWQTAGAPGLVGLKLSCVAASVALLSSAWRRAGLTGHSRVLLAGIMLLGILPRVSHVRPQLFSVVLFAALLCIFHLSRQGSVHWLAANIPVLVLWANFHGGWLVGLGTVVIWAVGEAWARRSDVRAAGVLLAYVIIAGIATLLNPYGVALWRFMSETVRFGREGIEEWGPAWTSPTFVTWVAFAALTIMALRKTSRSENPATVLLPVFWGVASLRVGRLDAFFAMSVVGLLFAPLAGVLGRGRQGPLLAGRWRWAAVVIALAVVLGASMGRTAFTCIGMNPARWPEPQAVEYMWRQRLSGRIVTFFDWGEYAIWNMPPGLKVSIDGRRETVYSESTVEKHLELYLGTAAGVAYVETLEADLMWLPAGLPVLDRLTGHGWAAVFEGPRSTLLAATTRHDLSSLERVVVAEEPQPRCFPGP